MNLSDLNNLDFSNAGSWPPLAKAIAVVIIIAAVAGAGYWFFTRHLLEELETVHRKEQDLRREFIEKQQVMASLEAYKSQLAEMQNMLNDMLRQLPTRTEMPDLLEDISNTGKDNGLNFELFKPETEQPREIFAAKPITIRARANYHQFGDFVSSIAALSRIVTVERVSLVEQQTRGDRATTRDDTRPLLIEATLQTYRYLDEGETAGAGGAGSMGRTR